MNSVGTGRVAFMSLVVESTIAVALILGLAVFGTIYFIIVIVSPPLLTPSPTERLYVCANSPSRGVPLSSLSEPASLALSVVIPAYNEVERLTPMLEATITHLDSRPSRSYEVLIIDDGSRDSTVPLALSLAKTHTSSDIRIIKLDRNVGKGGAVRHGFMHARGGRLLMVDADGASQFEDLELLWKEMDRVEQDGFAVAIGSRAHMIGTDAVVKRSAVRNFLMHSFHFVLRTLGVRHIRDTQCGFKLFSRKAAQRLFPYQHLRTWVFDVELLIMAQSLHIPVVEVPITWHEVAGSKLSVMSDSLGMLKDLFILRANHSLGRWTVNRGKVKED